MREAQPETPEQTKTHSRESVTERRLQSVTLPLLSEKLLRQLAAVEKRVHPLEKAVALTEQMALRDRNLFSRLLPSGHHQAHTP